LNKNDDDKIGQAGKEEKSPDWFVREKRV